VTTIPVIDLGDDTHRVAAEIGRACAEVGFFQIVNHGVAAATVDAAWAATRGFFDAPDDVRAAVAVPYAGYPYGYLGLATETLASSLGADTPPDRKHSFSFGPIDPPPTTPTDPDELWIRSPSQWPTEPAGFRAAMEQYFAAMAALAAHLLGRMAVALDLEATYFDAMIDHHVSALRCLDYPKLDAAPLPGQLRAGAHCDYGTLTILRTAPGVNGLETFDGEHWSAVDAVDDGFVVNLGDSLARWTNDRWRSTLHRVVEGDDAGRRTSIAFFHTANWDARIECLPGLGEPRYQPVLAGRHLMEKFHRTVGA